MDDIYYIVTIKDAYVNYFDETIITSKFCGKVFLTKEDKTYFKLNGSGAVVIIPNDWILCMAPSIKLWTFKEVKLNEFGEPIV